MSKNRIRTIGLTAAALALAGSISVGSAMAYFTTYTVAEGGVKLSLGPVKTEIEEQVVNGKKELILANTGDFDCYVRIRALTGNVHKDGILYSEPGTEKKWTPGPAAEGYYYYADILEPGARTTQLDVGFQFPEGEEPADFNVIIIQECTPVLYDDNGDPYADWNVKADISSSVYNGEGE